MQHSTTQPEQVQTDHFMVFDRDVNHEMELVAQIEIPRFSRPNTEGVRLSKDKRLALAAYRAVEMDPYRDPDTVMVLDEIGNDYETVSVEQNPAFDAVWDPEVETA